MLGSGGCTKSKSQSLLLPPRDLQFREAGARRCLGRGFSGERLLRGEALGGHISDGMHIKERTVFSSGLMVAEA